MNSELVIEALCIERAAGTKDATVNKVVLCLTSSKCLIAESALNS